MPPRSLNEKFLERLVERLAVRFAEVLEDRWGKPAGRPRPKGRTKSSRATEDFGLPIDPEKSYTTEQLMRDAQVSSATIGRWRRMGLVPTRMGKRNRYRGADVLKFLHPEQ